MAYYFIVLNKDEIDSTTLINSEFYQIMPNQPMHMKRILFLLFAFVFINSEGNAQLQVQSLLTENLPDPISINEMHPRFSWKLVSDKRNLMQTAYEIRVGKDISSIGNNKNLLWSSGKVSSDSSVQLVYKGTALQPATKYFWQVRAWDNQGNVSPWSRIASWQIGNSSIRLTSS